MTKVAETPNLTESHWLLVFGEDVRYLPTTLSALFDRQLMHVPQKVTVYHELQRHLNVVKPQLGTRLYEHKAVFKTLNRLTPIRKDGTLIESVNTETDLDAVKESLERFVRAASDDKKAPLQIMMMGGWRQVRRHYSSCHLALRNTPHRPFCHQHVASDRYSYAPLPQASALFRE